MPFELIKEYIIVDQEVSSFDTQTSLEELVKIADYKPNIRNILFVNGEVNVAKQSVEGNILNIDGDLNYKIYYVAEGGYLECTKSTVPYDYSVELQDLEGDIECCINTNLEHIDYRITNSRKVNIKSVMKIQGKIIKKSSIPMLKDVREMENVQKLNDKIIITKSSIKNNEKISIKNSIDIGELDETALKLIDISTNIIELKSNKSPSGVLLSGKILLKGLYSIESEEKKDYKNIEEVVEFSQFIEKTGVDRIDNYFYVPSVKNMTYDFVTLEGENDIQLEIDLGINTDITFYENIEFENIQDLYSPEVKTDIINEQIKTYFLAADFKENVNVTEDIVIPTEMPIEKVLLVQGDIVVSDIETSQNNINLEGAIDLKMIYKLSSEVDVIEKFEKQIPFTYSVSSNKNSNELFDFNALVEEIRINQRGNSFNVEVETLLTGNLYNKISLNLVKEIIKVETDEKEETGEHYAIKAHYKQPGETLWDIAKENSTTIIKILNDNNIENEENVKDYDPLVILK
ncbi:MAG: DUF3794 domain-containing protein [Eubacteriaceae bacterium]